jgi:dihydrofolate reductase
MVSLIAAMARNRVIGVQNKLPWHLPEDLRYFRRVTQGHPVVMGRKTYESIGRLLPGRENRIVSRQPDYQVEGARVFADLREACEAAPLAVSGAAGGTEAGTEAGAQEIFVIGGAQIYGEALAYADRLYITQIDAEVAGDAYFPEWEAGQFVEISRETHAADGERAYGFAFVVLERVPS